MHALESKNLQTILLKHGKLSKRSILTNSAVSFKARWVFVCIYLDLPRGVEWMIRGAYTPSLRVQTDPLKRCWHIYCIYIYKFYLYHPCKLYFQYFHLSVLVQFSLSCRENCRKPYLRVEPDANPCWDVFFFDGVSHPPRVWRQHPSASGLIKLWIFWVEGFPTKKITASIKLSSWFPYSLVFLPNTSDRPTTFLPFGKTYFRGLCSVSFREARWWQVSKIFWEFSPRKLGGR